MSTASVAATSGAPAGFLLRLVASIIDGVILSIVVFLLSMVLGFVFGMNGIMMATIIAYAIGGVLALLYWAKLESGKDQATLGKKVMKIKVTSASGGPLDFATAAKRSVVHWVFYLTAALDTILGLSNYLISAIVGILVLVSCIAVAFKANKQGFHDDFAGAQVARA